SLLDACALLDVLEDLRIARFETDDQQTAARCFHRFKRFVVGVNSRSARPRSFERLQLFTNRDGSVLGPSECVIIKENFFEVWEKSPRVFDFGRDVLGTARSPRMPADGLRPKTKRAKRRTASRCIEGDIRIQQERNVVLRDIEITLVNVGCKRQRIQIVKRRAIRVVNYAAVLAEACALDLL